MDRQQLIAASTKLPQWITMSPVSPSAHATLSEIVASDVTIAIKHAGSPADFSEILAISEQLHTTDAGVQIQVCKTVVDVPESTVALLSPNFPETVPFPAPQFVELIDQLREMFLAVQPEEKVVSHGMSNICNPHPVSFWASPTIWDTS